MINDEKESQTRSVLRAREDLRTAFYPLRAQKSHYATVSIDLK